MAVKKKTTAKRKTTAKKTTAKKAVARKAPAKRATARKAPARKVAAKKAPVAKKLKTTAIADAMTKSELFTNIADATELNKKQVSAVFEELESIIERHLKKRGAGMFTLPGLLKCSVVRKPATKARKGINPFTGEPTIFKAKPARNIVKVRPLKKVKEMAL